MFTKREWSQWKHITFVKDFRPGITVYELLRRECVKTKDVQWKRVKVKSCVHDLADELIEITRDLIN